MKTKLPGSVLVVLTFASVEASVLIFKDKDGRLKVAPGVKAIAGAARRKAEESFIVDDVLFSFYRKSMVVERRLPASSGLKSLWTSIIDYACKELTYVSRRCAHQKNDANTKPALQIIRDHHVTGFPN